MATIIDTYHVPVLLEESRIQIILFGSENQPSGLTASHAVIIITCSFYFFPCIGNGTACFWIQIVIEFSIFDGTGQHFSGGSAKYIVLFADSLKPLLKFTLGIKVILVFVDCSNFITYSLAIRRKVIGLLTDRDPGLLSHGAVCRIKIIIIAVAFTQTGFQNAGGSSVISFAFIFPPSGDQGTICTADIKFTVIFGNLIRDQSAVGVKEIFFLADGLQTDGLLSVAIISFIIIILSFIKIL